jgi:hypothetical protein
MQRHKFAGLGLLLVVFATRDAIQKNPGAMAFPGDPKAALAVATQESKFHQPLGQLDLLVFGQSRDRRHLMQRRSEISVRVPRRVQHAKPVKLRLALAQRAAKLLQLGAKLIELRFPLTARRAAASVEA